MTIIYRFDQIAENINFRIMPGEMNLDRYIGLEHLDPESLKIRRWGSPDDVIGQKLHFWEGDIIYGRRRAYQRKLAVADFKGICSAHAMVLRAKPDVCLPEFLPFFMQSELFHQRALEISVGSLSPTINWRTLAGQEFPLPPLDEQRRIAELLYAVEECVQAQTNTVAKIKELRASFVKSVVTKSNKLCKDTVDSTLDKVAEIIVGQSPSGDSYNSIGKGIPLLNGPTEFGEVYPTPVQWTTKPTKFCKPGDILFCVRGSTTGRQNISNGEYCIGRGLSAIRGSEGKSLTGFLKIILEGLEGEVLQEARGAGSTFPNITSRRLANLKLPFVSLAQQSLLTEQFTNIQNIQVLAANHLANIQTLKKGILKKVLSPDSYE